MASKILFIADNIDNFNTDTDTTYLIMLSCKDMIVDVYYCNQNHLFVTNNGYNCVVKAKVYKLDVQYGCDQIHCLKQRWYYIEQKLILDLNEFDAILVRKDPPFDLEYYMMAQLLNIASNYGAKIFNRPHDLICYNEKLSTLQFPQFIAPFIISKNKKELLAFIKQNDACIIKPINMMAGAGVIKTANDDPNLLALLEISSSNFNTTIMVQKFIPAITEGDKRVFIINGVVLKYCLIRTPVANSIRSNIAAGGKATVSVIDDQTLAIAQSVALWSLNTGLSFIGLDIIGNYLNEINITSPTGLCQIYQHSGVNGAKLWLDHCLQKYDNNTISN